ncbi:MAG: aromatic amino acid ammonia-lyase [Rhodobacteraceae bacterium]|jgi:tyrosine ammonia-lyase|nr:aromatic amino acid ammonia-lyase [Paracoccaceae bacterium]
MTHTLPPVLTLDRALPLHQAAAVARGRHRLALSPAAQARLADGHGRLQGVIAARRHVYGLTTGFGPLADRLVDPADGVTLQQNLVHHLASGVGPALDWDEARAMVLARLLSLVQGVSGASPAVAGALVALLNSPYAPEIPSRGTVGASGDLTPLAHMVLCLQGCGRLLTRDGARVDAAAVVGTALPRLDLSGRDGLALVNGTSAMTGCALLTAVDTAEALGVAIALSAAMAEVQRGRIEAWHPAFARYRPHPGQARVAAALIARVEGSDRVERRPVAASILAADETRGTSAGRRIGQDAYTLRCVPQVLGAVADTLDWHDRVVTTELQSVTDNPLFPAPAEDDPDLAPALHGGNFMGQHVGLASDALSNAVIVMAGLAERQIARLTDERLNDGLPAFLHRGRPGLNSGFMGAQVTATALLAELRAGGGAASIQSISTNGANQDVVSMGTIAARLVRKRLELTRHIHAILGLALAQAMDLRAEHDHRADRDERLHDSCDPTMDRCPEAGLQRQAPVVGPLPTAQGRPDSAVPVDAVPDRGVADSVLPDSGVPTLATAVLATAVADGMVADSPVSDTETMNGDPRATHTRKDDRSDGHSTQANAPDAGDPAALHGFSPAARSLHALVRRTSAPLLADRPLGPEITALADVLRGDPGSLRWSFQAA